MMKSLTTTEVELEHLCIIRQLIFIIYSGTVK